MLWCATNVLRAISGDRVGRGLCRRARRDPHLVQLVCSLCTVCAVLRRDPACQSCTHSCTHCKLHIHKQSALAPAAHVHSAMHMCTVHKWVEVQKPSTILRMLCPMQPNAGLPGCSRLIVIILLLFHQLHKKVTSSWPRCGETESRSESASLPSRSFLRLSDEGKERVESEGASESTLPVIEAVFAWKC